MIQDFIVPFLTTSIAELGDKTQLAVLCIASKTKKHLQLLLGIILAFIVADGLAVLLGDILTKFIPMNYIKIGSGVLFIIFGIITLRDKDEDEKKCDIRNPFVSGFTMLLMCEMGDKTQLSAALFATRFNPFFVLLGTITAMTLLSILALYLGKFIMTKVPKKTITLIAGILFIIIGIWNFF
jgi:Ca2+/H+ antiporter, TMEM165/GDT1 family